MAYQLNLNSSPNSGSNLTSSMFSNQTAVSQYANAVPASKVILGLPFFGYDWPTTNGTLNAVTCRRSHHHHLRPGSRERVIPNAPGCGHKHRLDVLPGRLALARGLLREPQFSCTSPRKWHRRTESVESGSGPSVWTARTIRRWCQPLTAMRRPRRTCWPGLPRPEGTSPDQVVLVLL